MRAFHQAWLAKRQARGASAAEPRRTKRRPPKPPLAQRPEPTELEIHIAVASHLRQRAVLGLWWFHPANGELRNARTAAKLKAMGVRRGVPDMVLLHGGRLHALELKRGAGRLSHEQHIAREEIERAGGLWAVAHGVDAALAILTAWGLLRPAGSNLERNAA